MCNCGISYELAEYILDHKYLVYEMFHKTMSPDELWVHSLVFNSKVRDRKYDTSDLRNGTMRYIDWERGCPYTCCTEVGDLQLLLNSPYIFARKFDEKANMEIVEEICKAVQNEDNVKYLLPITVKI